MEALQRIDLPKHVGSSTFVKYHKILCFTIGMIILADLKEEYFLLRVKLRLFLHKDLTDIRLMVYNTEYD